MRLGSWPIGGFELERKGEFLVLHQRSFTAELLLRYPGKEKSDLPIVPKSGELNPPPEEADPALVRECQQLAGELLWLSTYTRPDLVFAVSTMTRLLSSRPREARSIGYQALLLAKTSRKWTRLRTPSWRLWSRRSLCEKDSVCR